MRLFCFPQAGGGTAIFKGWNRALGPGVEVVLVEVGGNRGRFATLRDLVDEVNGHLDADLDGPHAFFGHSFGALLAFRLACRRLELGATLPRAVLVSAYGPPHLPPPIPVVDHLDNQQLATLLADLGGISPELTRWPTLRDGAAAATRMDMRLCMTDDDSDFVTLPCPIKAFGGSADPLVSDSELNEWRSRTSAEFSLQILRGDHFYLTDRTQLMAALRPTLSALAMSGVRC
jgi:surfactin synthase thioesterase subunit